MVMRSPLWRNGRKGVARNCWSNSGRTSGQSSAYAPVSTILKDGYAFAMDYLQTDPDIDPPRWRSSATRAAARQRSGPGRGTPASRRPSPTTRGSTGAKLARRGDEGGGAQTVAGSNNSYPHWYPPTYKAYNNRVRELPVDQHELLALIAPRRVVVASATQDAHADPQGEFLASLAAAPVYELRARRHRSAFVDLATTISCGSTITNVRRGSGTRGRSTERNRMPVACSLDQGTSG
jgi:hypothetical protein